MKNNTIEIYEKASELYDAIHIPADKELVEKYRDYYGFGTTAEEMIEIGERLELLPKEEAIKYLDNLLKEENESAKNGYVDAEQMSKMLDNIELISEDKAIAFLDKERK